MTDRDENDELLERLGALPAHDVAPEVRDAIAARADGVLAREARPARRIARLYRAVELPMLAMAACLYLVWNFANVAQVHREASVEISPRLAAGVGAAAAYTASREDVRMVDDGDRRPGRGLRRPSRRGA